MTINSIPLTFTAIDIETATSNQASICQIGLVRVLNGTIVSRESILIQPPGNEYSARHSCIHGIHALMTKDKPFFHEVWDYIKEELSTTLLVAHNASFDISALYSALEYCNLKAPEFNYECTYRLTNLKLSELCDALEICLTNHHDALADASACAEAYIKLTRGIKPNPSLIKSTKADSSFAGHERITGDLLQPDLDCEDKNHPFYNKKIVFTGVLNKISREEAAQLAKANGADIDTGISKRTQFVIVGHGAGPSKLKKIEEYNASGSNIQIVYEEEFLRMLY